MGVTKEILDNAIEPMVKIKYPKFTGYFSRKLKRAQTVHLRAQCPKCGRYGIRFYKTWRINSKTSIHNVWVCPDCGKAFERKELDYVKYC